MRKVLKRKDIPKYKQQCIESQGAHCPLTMTLLIPANTVLDHNHTDGAVRQTIDRNCNQYIGKIEQNYKRFLGYRPGMVPLPVLLRRIADYLETDYTKNPLHPGHIDLSIRKFSRLNKKAQDALLLQEGITPGSTSKERTKQYKLHWYREDNLYR